MQPVYIIGRTLSEHPNKENKNEKKDKATIDIVRACHYNR